jgi:hypothetical protein
VLNRPAAPHDKKDETAQNALEEVQQQE